LVNRNRFNPLPEPETYEAFSRGLHHEVQATKSDVEKFRNKAVNLLKLNGPGLDNGRKRGRRRNRRSRGTEATMGKIRNKAVNLLKLKDRT
jgi:hypothetical protein